MAEDRNLEFLSASLKNFQARRWEIFGANITDAIRVTIRVPRASLNTRSSPAEQAVAIGQDLSRFGWRLTGFAYDQDNLNVDLVHDLMVS